MIFGIILICLHLLLKGQFTSKQVESHSLGVFVITLVCLMQGSSSISDFHSLCVKIFFSVLFTLGTS